MTALSVVILHGGHALEVGALEFLLRTLQYLLAVAGLAVLFYVGMDAYSAIVSRFT